MKNLKYIVWLLLHIFLIHTSTAWSNAQVIFVQPVPQSMANLEQLEIVVEFDSAIDPASVNAGSFQVFGRWTGVCPGNIVFENNNLRIRFEPQKDFSAGEWITVNLTRDIQTQTGENLTAGYAWNFWTTARPGSFELSRNTFVSVRQPNEPQIRTYGAYAGDLNGDGFHDFTVPNEDASDIRVFINSDGNYSSFTVYPLPSGTAPSTNEGADFNNDGLLDFAAGQIAGGAVSVLFGDGTGGFQQPTTYPTASGTRGLCVLDLNGDGATDIVTANRAGNNISILLNNGDGSFAQRVNMDAGVSGETSCAAADANGDGLLDVFVGGFNSREMAILLSDGNGNLTLSDVADARGVAWMIAAGDLDGDGNADVVSANSFGNQFSVLFGDGQGGLSDATAYSTGNFPLAIDVGDIDGDGDLDVVTSNFQSADWTLFENDGTGAFISKKRLLTSRAGSCAVLHDRDRDGDLDMTGIDEIDDLLVLFENPATPTHVAPDSPPIAVDFQLKQSFPNPFSKSNKVLSNHSRISIPFSLQQTSKVKLEIVNLKGQTVELLLDTVMQSGDHNVPVAPQSLSAGVYFYRLATPSGSISKKMIILP